MQLLKAGRYDLDEASMGRIYQHILSNPKTKSWGIVTASRGELTSAENKQRNKELENKLRSLGVGFVHIDGMWRECRDKDIEYSDCPDDSKVPTEEKSFFIPNISKKDIHRLGNEYEQDSVIYGGDDTDMNAHLIFKNGSENNIGKFTASKISQGYSKMQGDRVFTFLEPGDSGEKYKKNKVDDVVYNTRTKTVGIVRMADERGETKTDADGNVNTDELEPFNPKKYPRQKNAKIAPSTKREIDTRGLGKSFTQKDEPTKEEPSSQKMVANPTQLKSLLPKGIANQTIKNPETGRMIKVKSALKYDKNSPVYKSTMAMVKNTKK